MGASLPPGLSRLSFINAPKMSGQFRSWVPNYSAYDTPVSATTWTLAGQWTLESSFDLARLVYTSPVASAFTIVKAAVSPSSAIGDGTTSYNSTGAADFTTWQPVYFNNAGADVAPKNQAVWGSGTTTFTIPANSGSLSQTPIYFSDWMRVVSLARTDGGTTPILLTRHLTDTTGTYRAHNTAQFTSNGRKIAPYIASGIDGVTTPGTLTGATSNSYLTPVGVQYMTRARGFTVLGVGDSLTYGLGASHPMNSWGSQSCLSVSSPLHPISWWNQGWPSQVSSDFWANGYKAFAACSPDVVTISVWSPNDGLTQAATDASFSRAMDFSNYVSKAGAVPVLMGPLPWNGITTTPQETARLSARSRMLEAAANGWVYALDWESVMGTGSSPNQLNPAYNSGGQPGHPNDAGNALMDSAVFRPVLRSVLGI